MPTELPPGQQQQQQQPRRATPQNPSQPDNDDNEDEWLFSCRCESAKSVSTLLSCLRHVSSSSSSLSSSDEKRSANSSNMIQPVTVYCAPTSLTFHVYGTARQSQASVDLQAGLFSEYHVLPVSTTNTNTATNNNDDNDDETTTNNQQQQQQQLAGGEFCVNLSTVLECLHVLGTQTLDRTKLSLSYNRATEIFKLELLEGEGGVLSTAAIPGMLPPTTSSTSSLALAFRSTPICARMIVKSEWLREALAELDVVQGATCCTVLLGPDGLELVAVGNLGECLITLPALNNQQTAIVSLECTKTEARSYTLNSFLSGMRGLGLAEESCISMNEAGMIAIQHQVLDTVGQGSPNFVDFIMTCLQDDDDESTTNRDSAPDRARSFQSPQSVPEHPYSLGWDEGSKRSVSVRITPATSSSGAAGKRNDDESEGEEDDLPPISKVPLFGAIETTISTSGSQKSKASAAASRKVRRRRRARQDDDSDDNDSDASQPMLGEEESTLDVTARAQTPPRRRRRIPQDEEDGSSSPELVYK